jgi:hypothetical protein
MSSPPNDPPLEQIAETDRPAPPDTPQDEDKTIKQDRGARKRSAERSRIPSAPGYVLLRLLGTGAYGEVWLAKEESSGVEVAVKFFHRGTGQQWELLEVEAQQLRRLQSDRGIVRLRAVVPDPSRPFYVMDYVENGSLEKRLKALREQAGGPRGLPPGEAFSLFEQVAQTLAYVHARGIRHCDLKPANILLDALHRPLVADFGQAHLASDASPALGTFFYMAPEQADLTDQIPDTCWDVYGLGALYYALLTGCPPRESPEVHARLRAAGTLEECLRVYREWMLTRPPAEDHRAAGVEEDLAQIIDRCLEIDPSRRFPGAGALVEELDGLEEKRRQRRAQAEHERLRRLELARRRRLLHQFGWAAIVLLVLAGGLALLLGRNTVEKSRQALANQVEDGDRVIAGLIARVMRERLKDRIAVLHRHAADAKLGQALLEFDAELNRRGREESEEARTKLLCDPDGKHRVGLQDRLANYHEEDNLGFFRWTLADAQGWMLADFPPESDLWGRCWAWRDWFNGTGHKFDRQGDAFPPVRRVYVSQPYIGVGTETRPLMLSISCPLWDPEDKSRLIGLLVGSLYVSDLYTWLEGVKLSRANGYVVVLNERGHCLLHPCREQIEPPADGNPTDWRPSSPVWQKAVDDEESGTMAQHQDPLDKKTYLGGYAPFGRLGEPMEEPRWAAVVQHEEEEVLRPVADLERGMLVFGLAAFLAVLASLVGVWTAFSRALRREERLVQDSGEEGVLASPSGRG